MSKKADRIITSVYLTKEMCGQIDKLADREHISRNEQIRRFIKKGLTVDGYTEDIDFIASISGGRLLLSTWMSSVSVAV